MKNWGFRENHHCITQNPEKNTVSIYFQKLGDELTLKALSYRIKIFNHLVENYTYLFNLRPNICKYHVLMYKHLFHSQ